MYMKIGWKRIKMYLKKRNIDTFEIHMIYVSDKFRMYDSGFILNENGD